MSEQKKETVRLFAPALYNRNPDDEIEIDVWAELDKAAEKFEKSTGTLEFLYGENPK